MYLDENVKKGIPKSQHLKHVKTRGDITPPLRDLVLVKQFNHIFYGFTGLYTGQIHFL